MYRFYASLMYQRPQSSLRSFGSSHVRRNASPSWFRDQYSSIHADAIVRTTRLGGYSVSVCVRGSLVYLPGLQPSFTPSQPPGYQCWTDSRHVLLSDRDSWSNNLAIATKRLCQAEHMKGFARKQRQIDCGCSPPSQKSRTALFGILSMLTCCRPSQRVRACAVSELSDRCMVALRATC